MKSKLIPASVKDRSPINVPVAPRVNVTPDMISSLSVSHFRYCVLFCYSVISLLNVSTFDVISLTSYETTSKLFVKTFISILINVIVSAVIILELVILQSVYNVVAAFGFCLIS